MNVLYDYQAFTVQRYGGISKCFVELIKNRPAEMDFNISILHSANEHLIESGIIGNVLPVGIDRTVFNKLPIKGKRTIWKYLKKCTFIPIADNLNRKYSVKMLKEGNFDVFHPTYFEDYFLQYLNGKPFVLTIHDMIPERIYGHKDPNNFQIVKKRKLSSLADAIVVVSEHTKKDVVELLHVPEHKVHVVYHGGPEPLKVKECPIVSDSYFLYVGNRSSYKNFASLVKDYSVVHQQYPSVKVICTSSDFTNEEKSLLIGYGLEEVFVHMNSNDKQLANLYSYALAFIYPSYYEGFGMPILEAYSYGCPVILNNRSCFPEIAGDAALYFDSDDKSSNISDILIKFLSREEMRDNLINKGYERLKQFSWKESSRNLFEIYRSIC